VTATRSDWQGEAAIAPGIGVFRGLSGNNKAHRHWAHQLSVGLNGPVHFDSPDGQNSFDAVLIPAGSQHCQLESHTLSLYIDPTSHLVSYLHIDVQGDSPWTALSAQTIDRLLQAFPDNCPVTQGLERLLNGSSAGELAPSSRMEKVLKNLKSALEDDRDVTRTDLAGIACLSPTRFSHWFREETGMPLRSYKKWLRLIHALEMAVVTRNLSEAAQMAGFADQSHFTRAVSQAFGIKPRDLLGLFSAEP